jgi:hypothetical protein
MRRKGALVLVCAALAGADWGQSPAHGAVRENPRAPAVSTSWNWSGYDVTVPRPDSGMPARKFSSVTGTWIQPSVVCDGSASFSVAWVGLDGDGSQTVEQTGTEANCTGYGPEYGAWFEMYPAYPVHLPLPVSPGDSITGTVYFKSGRFVLALRNNTTGQGFRVAKPLKEAERHSAEAIAEAPSGLLGVLPLANFGTTTFTNVKVDGAPIGSFPMLDRIDMVDDTTTKTSTSELSGGTDFAVTWLNY